jgi:8-oxo-dGTP pyrophosphatase MutT (NUDIX family)
LADRKVPAGAVTIREAATLMLVRDDPDLHVFMLRRNADSVFVGGASVFPGGAVDATDREPALLARCHGRTDAEASTQLGVVRGGLRFWVAAIRESFEEAGVLTARAAATGKPVDVGDPASGQRLEAARRALNRGGGRFLDVVLAEDLMLDVGALHVFSHWVTPPGAPRRYDTWFFLAAAPEGHTYLHDDREAVASEWVRPAEALAGAQRGERQLIFPTMRSLAALARFETAGALVDATREATRGPRPRFVADHNGERIALPGDLAKGVA